MTGNAAEWVEDCWNDNYRGAPAAIGMTSRMPRTCIARRLLQQRPDICVQRRGSNTIIDVSILHQLASGVVREN